MAERISLRPLASWPALLMASLAASAAVHALEIEPAVGLTLIATDNVTLAPDGEEMGDFVTLLTPSLRINSSGARYDFSTDYRMDALYYARLDDSTRIFNNLDSRLNLRVIGDNLLLNNRASVAQVITDPEGPLPRNNIPSAGNRSNAVTLETQPVWQQNLFGNTLRSAYTLGQTSYGDRDLEKQTYHFLDTRLVSPEVERGLSWDVMHEYRRYQYDNELIPDFRRQQLMLSLFWNVGNGWAPFASIGLESDYRDREGSSLEDTTWRAGIRRTTERLIVQLAAGERSFGSSFDALLEFRYGSDSRDIIRFTYTEQPVNTEESQRRRLVEFLPDDPELPPALEGPGTGSVYTRKRAQLLVRRGFVRSSIAVVGYVDRAEDFLTRDGSPRNDRRQYGASANADYELGVRTTARGSLSYTDRRFDIVDGVRNKDRIWNARLALDYDLGRLTRASAYVARQQRSDSRGTINDYTENQIGISINRRFF